MKCCHFNSKVSKNHCIFLMDVSKRLWSQNFVNIKFFHSRRDKKPGVPGGMRNMVWKIVGIVVCPEFEQIWCTRVNFRQSRSSRGNSERHSGLSVYGGLWRPRGSDRSHLRDRNQCMLHWEAVEHQNSQSGSQRKWPGIQNCFLTYYQNVINCDFIGCYLLCYFFLGQFHW